MKRLVLLIGTICLFGFQNEEWADPDVEVYQILESNELTCTKGCRCGNACIDCSKTCHKGGCGG